MNFCDFSRLAVKSLTHQSTHFSSFVFEWISVHMHGTHYRPRGIQTVQPARYISTGRPSIGRWLPVSIATFYVQCLAFQLKVPSSRSPHPQPSGENPMVSALIALTLLALNWVHLGRPAGLPEAAGDIARAVVSRYGSSRDRGPGLSTMQKRCVNLVRERVRCFASLVNRLGSLGDAGGRTVDSIVASLKLLLSQSAGGPSAGAARALDPASLLITPGKLSLPSAQFTASFRPERFLPSDLRRRFLDPEENLLPEDERPRAKATRVHVAPQQHRALLERLDGAAMIEFEPTEVAPRGLLGESLASGAFRVAKSSVEDRLVLNRTTTNSQEKPFNVCKWLFPHGSQFCEIVLQPNERLVGSVSDLSVFFYCCGTSRARSLWNQFGRPVPLYSVKGLAAAERFCIREGLGLGRCQDLPQGKGREESGRLVTPVLRPVAMGDLNATCVTELAHINLFRTAGLAVTHELLSYHSPVPRSSRWHGIMVDDSVVVEKQPRRARAAGAGRADSPYFDACLDVYRLENLPVKDAKVLRSEQTFEALGAYVDGERGWSCARPGLLLHAYALGAACLRSRNVSATAAAALTGVLAFVLMFRREAFALLDKLFRFARRGGGRLGPAERDELLTLLFLLPLFGTNLRADVEPRLFATDAAGATRTRLPMGGFCYARLPPQCARELWRHRLRRSQGYALICSQSELVENRVREMLLATGTPRVEVELLLPDRPTTYEPTRAWVGELVRGLNWEKAFAFGLPLEHINISEGRALRVVSRRCLREGVTSRRLLILCDSTAASGAAAKGRSPSRRLNGVQRGAVAGLLFGDLYQGILPVASGENIADDPSRLEDLRQFFDSDVVDWVRRFLDGEIGAIDDVLVADLREGMLFGLNASPGLEHCHRDDWAVPAREFIAAHVGGQKPVGLRVGDENSLAGDGPRQRHTERDLTLDLREPVHLANTTRVRLKIYHEFNVFCQQDGPAAPDLLRLAAPTQLDAKLADFGNMLYRSERSKHDFAELLNYVSELREDWRPLIGRARRFARRWVVLEPVHHHAPAPAVLVLGIVTLALLLRSPRFAAVVMAAYFGGLRPEDFTTLTDQSFVWSPDGNALFLVIGEVVGTSRPKTAGRGGAMAQHVRIDDPFALGFFRHWDGRLEPGERLWRWSKDVFRARWNAALDFFDIDCSDEHGFVPGSLRAGAASALYLQGAQLMDIKWFLRHNVRESGFGSLAHYVQELPAVMGRARVVARSPGLRVFANAVSPAVTDFFKSGWTSHLAYRPVARPRRPRAALSDADDDALVHAHAPPQRGTLKRRPSFIKELGDSLHDGGYWVPLGAPAPA